MASLPRKARPVKLPRKRPAFSSPQRAQFWFEWRQYGLLLPIYVGAVALAYFLGQPLVVAVFSLSDVAGPSGEEPLFYIDWFTSAQFIATGVVLAALIGGIIVGGVMFMRAGHWNSQSNYLLTRPLSLARISNARIRAVFLSAAFATAILFLLVLVLEIVTRIQGESTGFAGFMHQGYEQLPIAFVLAVFALGLLLMMWTFAWSASYIYIMAVFAVLVIPPMAVIWGGALFGFIGLEQAQEQTQAVLPYLNWTAAIVLMAGLLVMAWFADSKGLLHPAIPWVAAAAWCAYSYVFVYYAQKWDVGIQPEEWAVRFPHPINWPVWVGISILPLVPLFLHPLMLERIRHR